MKDISKLYAAIVRGVGKRMLSLHKKRFTCSIGKFVGLLNSNITPARFLLSMRLANALLIGMRR